MLTTVESMAGRAWRGALGFAMLLSVSSQANAADRVERFAADGWLLTVRHDGFIGRIACAMRSVDKRMYYQPRAVGFVVKSRDTLGAWYRLDGGAAYRWQDRYPTLLAQGVTVEGPGLDNPTGGIVWLPEDELRNVESVAIRATPRGRVRTFTVRGYQTLASAARRLGCWKA